MRMDANHRTSHEARNTASAAADPAAASWRLAAWATASPTTATSHAMPALIRATTIRRVSTASRANAHRVRSPLSQRSAALNASPMYIATTAARISGTIDPCVDTLVASGLTMANAAAAVAADVHATMALWKRALASTSMVRRLWKTTRTLKARTKHARVSAGSK